MSAVSSQLSHAIEASQKSLAQNVGAGNSTSSSGYCLNNGSNWPPLHSRPPHLGPQTSPYDLSTSRNYAGQFTAPFSSPQFYGMPNHFQVHHNGFQYVQHQFQPTSSQNSMWVNETPPSLHLNVSGAELRAASANSSQHVHNHGFNGLSNGQNPSTNANTNGNNLEGGRSVSSDKQSDKRSDKQPGHNHEGLQDVNDGRAEQDSRENLGQENPAQDDIALGSLLSNFDSETTWASRNPGKAVQASRQRAYKPMTDAERISSKMRTEKSREDSQLLHDAVAEVQDYCKAKAEEIAKQFNRKPDYVYRLIHSATIFKPTRNPNIFNALVHKKAKEVNAGA